MAYTLITGASGGIGFALAEEFAKNHHNLILVARNEDKLKILGLLIFGNIAKNLQYTEGG